MITQDRLQDSLSSPPSQIHLISQGLSVRKKGDPVRLDLTFPPDLGGGR